MRVLYAHFVEYSTECWFFITFVEKYAFTLVSITIPIIMEQSSRLLSMREVLTPVADAVSREPTMLPVNFEGLEKSLVDGLATVRFNEQGEVVGFARLIPLMSAEQFVEMGISGLGTVWEVGTVWVDNNYRSNGLAQDMTRELIGGLAQQDLVISTTKIPKGVCSEKGYAGAFVRAAREEGFDPCVGPFYEFTWIQALTCVCRPLFGLGVQHGVHACHQRVDNEYTTGQEKTCVLLVHSDKQAVRFNQALMQHYHNVEAFITYLMSNNHYA